MISLVKQVLTMVVGGLIVAGGFYVTGALANQEAPLGATATEGTLAVSSTLPVFQYQGQLLSPTTGQPVADGTYPITFRLYQDMGGAQESFWGEQVSVPVSRGLFSVVLGSTAASPIPVTAFDGRQLHLGVQVGSDPEMTPRQPIYPVPSAMNARFFNGLTTSDFVESRRGPVAYGIVNADGSRQKGYRFGSSRHTLGEYVIEIKDADGNTIDYNLNDYVTQVTVIEDTTTCPNGYFATSGSRDGKLLIDLYESHSIQRDCKFHFTVLQP